MPVLSVLTAVLGRWPEFVVEAGESLAGQRLPAGWQLEWVIQEDGANPCLADLVARFPFTSYAANGQQLGLATTRNLGLVRVSGPIVQVLDGDDVMLPGGPSTVIEAFRAHPEIHWVATQADNLMPDGARVAFDPISPIGPVAAGAVNDYILDRYRGPFLYNGMAMRTATVRALGGWVADPVGEDFGLVTAITETAPGYYTPERTYLYRQHDGQITRRPDWITVQRISQWTARLRIDALRAVGLRIGAV